MTQPVSLSDLSLGSSFSNGVSAGLLPYAGRFDRQRERTGVDPWPHRGWTLEVSTEEPQWCHDCFPVSHPSEVRRVSVCIVRAVIGSCIGSGLLPWSSQVSVGC